MKPSIVICSSFRFYQQVLELQTILSQAGYYCEVPLPNEHLDPDRPWILRNGLMVREPAIFEAFWRNMRMHHDRIIRSDLVYVFAGKEGYVGIGVSSEIGFTYAIKHHCPEQKGKAIISSHTLSDRAMRGYVEEVVAPKDLVSRLS